MHATAMVCIVEVGTIVNVVGIFFAEGLITATRPDVDWNRAQHFQAVRSVVKDWLQELRDVPSKF
jgi:hypothetical protein